MGGWPQKLKQMMYFDTIMSTAVESTESTMQIIPNGSNIGAIVQCGNVTINVHNHTIVDGRSNAYDAAHHGGSTVPSTAASMHASNGAQHLWR